MYPKERKKPITFEVKGQGHCYSSPRTWVAQWVRSLDQTTHTSLSPIRRGFAPGFVNYIKGCTRLAAASDKVYQLLAHGRWFSPASSTTKSGRHDIAEILLKVALNAKKNQIKSNLLPSYLNIYFHILLSERFGAHLLSVKTFAWCSKNKMEKESKTFFKLLFLTKSASNKSNILARPIGIFVPDTPDTTAWYDSPIAGP